MRRRARRERGVALLVLLLVLGVGASWLFVSRLNSESGARAAQTKQRNADVLARAKLALMVYTAQQAARVGENDPGALPCPEAPGNYGNPEFEGTAAGFCTLPAVGRFPWRTVGMDKLVDGSGEPLWYVVASAWAKPSSTTNTVINSNCASAPSGMACATSQLTVDGAANASVALVIAPGPAFAVAANAASGCVAHSQARPVAGPLDVRNYLECENATSPADSIFVTSGPAGSFNDQVVTVTAAELLPYVEAAIADRIEREIAPILKDVYVAPNWGLASFGAPAVPDRVYPYAASFGNPATSSYTGTAGTVAGLLPFAHMETFPGSGIACTAGAANPRCNPTLVRWSNASPSVSFVGADAFSSTCSYWGPTSWAECFGTYTGSPTRVTLTGPQSNGAMSLRRLNANALGWVFWWDLTTFSFSWSQPAPAVALSSDGTFSVSITAAPPAPADPVVGVMYWVYAPGNATSDHGLLDGRPSSPPGPPASAWFARNRWHELVYYAVAPGYTAAAAAPRACTTGTTCLSVLNVAPGGAQRAILVLAGRSINGSARPSPTLGDYLEFGNAAGAFERQAVSSAVDPVAKKPFNDRVVKVDWNSN
jgi:hypothetical protein